VQLGIIRKGTTTRTAAFIRFITHFLRAIVMRNGDLLRGRSACSVNRCENRLMITMETNANIALVIAIKYSRGGNGRKSNSYHDCSTVIKAKRV